MILLIDNYDSFTYNLFQYVSELGKEVKVVRNDAISIAEIKAMQPEAIILSPGPGAPAQAGICIDVVKELGEQFPILGICLGHQAIGEAFGGEVVHARHIKHGKTSVMKFDEDVIFNALAKPVEVMRYHSLSVKAESIPNILEVIGTSEEDDEIMAFKHRELPIVGLQFHPESIGTKEGKTILQNFLTLFEKERLTS